MEREMAHRESIAKGLMGKQYAEQIKVLEAELRAKDQQIESLSRAKDGIEVELSEAKSRID